MSRLWVFLIQINSVKTKVTGRLKSKLEETCPLSRDRHFVPRGPRDW